MKKRLKTVFTILFALIFSIFFPSFGLCGNEGILMQNPGLDIRAEVEYTDDSDHGILHHSFMCMEGQKGLFWAQNFEQPKPICRFSIELFGIFVLFSCILLIYLSYIQFCSSHFERFLWEHDILLEKDGKKRDIVFKIKKIQDVIKKVRKNENFDFNVSGNAHWPGFSSSGNFRRCFMCDFWYI